MRKNITGKYPNFAAYFELARPRLTLLVVLSAMTGFYLGAIGKIDLLRLLYTLLGIALASGGASSLNQFIEREYDALMRRTRGRPLPSRRLHPRKALLFGAFLSLGSVLYLAWVVNLLTSFLVLVTIVSYIFIYTPLKRISSFNTTVGAIPGALPIVCGWTAARNTLNVESLILFGILFCWQFPHFLSIALLYRKDYRRAGYKMLPSANNGTRKTNQHIIVSCVALILFSILPVFVGLTGTLYFVIALLAGGMFLIYGISAAVYQTSALIRRLMLASFIYPLVVWGGMIVDKAAV